MTDTATTEQTAILDPENYIATAVSLLDTTSSAVTRDEKIRLAIATHYINLAELLTYSDADPAYVAIVAGMLESADSHRRENRHVDAEQLLEKIKPLHRACHVSGSARARKHRWDDQ